jgi:hypothetical protein
LPSNTLCATIDKGKKFGLVFTSLDSIRNDPVDKLQRIKGILKRILELQGKYVFAYVGAEVTQLARNPSPAYFKLCLQLQTLWRQVSNHYKKSKIVIAGTIR